MSPPRLLRAARALIIASALTAAVGCEEPLHPTDDPIEGLLGALERRDWEAVAPYFSEERPLAELPLKRDLDAGHAWAGVRRARLMDNHLVFDVDVRAPGAAEGAEQVFRRHTFWAVAPEAALGGKRQEGARVGQIAGWAPPRPAQAAHIAPHEIDAPARFSATSFRGVPALSTLGVFGQDAHAEEFGWAATLMSLTPELREQKKRGCKRVNMRALQPVLEREVSRCLPLLADAMRRTYARGDQAIHADAAILDANRSAFGGRLSLSVDLSVEPSLRPAPTLGESMLTATDFTQCATRAVGGWSRDFVEQAPCDLSLPMLFKVVMPEKGALLKGGEGVEIEGLEEPAGAPEGRGGEEGVAR